MSTAVEATGAQIRSRTPIQCVEVKHYAPRRVRPPVAIDFLRTTRLHAGTVGVEDKGPQAGNDRQSRSQKLDAVAFVRKSGPLPSRREAGFSSQSGQPRRILVLELLAPV